MEARDARPDQQVVATICWSCGTQLYKTVPRRRRGSGHVHWACDDCGVVWSEPTAPTPTAPTPTAPTPTAQTPTAQTPTAQTPTAQTPRAA